MCQALHCALYNSKPFGLQKQSHEERAGGSSSYRWEAQDKVPGQRRGRAVGKSRGSGRGFAARFS